jgi:hypothetical protein
MNQTVLKNQLEVALIESACKFVRAALVSQLNDKLLAQLVSVRLAQLLERENPYWYRIYSAGDVIKRLLDDFLHAKEKPNFSISLNRCPKKPSRTRAATSNNTAQAAQAAQASLQGPQASDPCRARITLLMIAITATVTRARGQWH